MIGRRRALNGGCISNTVDAEEDPDLCPTFDLPSYTLPIAVAIFWCLRQILGADPRVSCERAFSELMRVLTHVECSLTDTVVTPEEITRMRARYLALPRAQRTVSIDVLEALVKFYTEIAARMEADEAHTGVRPKSSWTVGRKSPGRLRDCTRSILEHVRNPQMTRGGMVDVQGLIAVKWMGVWCVASILHYVLDVPVYVPGDSRVCSNAKRCDGLVAAVRAFRDRPSDKAIRCEDLDAYLLTKYGSERAMCTNPRRRKRKRGCDETTRCDACVACLMMGEPLRIVYVCLNTPNVLPATIEATLAVADALIRPRIHQIHPRIVLTSGGGAHG